jgi:CopG antitoxin of type II toxin-antitoxin system
MEETIMAKMPTTDSIQELADFWQHHDVTDFESDLEEVSEPVFRRTYIVGVALTSDEHQAIRDAANRRGVDEAAVIHEWIKEKLGYR